MGLSIRAKADTVATFRFISVYLMETLARWVPTTPELEAKVLFGRHIWDLAQHADLLGKRTAELRASLHFSLRPTDDYMRALETLRPATQTADRVFGFYDGFLPSLEARYRHYLDQADPMLDEPTVRIMERILTDLTRLRAERAEFSRERPDITLTDSAWPTRIHALAAAPESFVVFRPNPAQPEFA